MTPAIIVHLPRGVVRKNKAATHNNDAGHEERSRASRFGSRLRSGELSRKGYSLPNMHTGRACEDNRKNLRCAVNNKPTANFKA